MLNDQAINTTTFISMNALKEKNQQGHLEIAPHIVLLNQVYKAALKGKENFDALPLKHGHRMDALTLGTFFGPILTVTTVWNTGETGDMNASNS